MEIRITQLINKCILIFLLLFSFLEASEQQYKIDTSKYNDEYTCFTDWIIHKDYNGGKPFRPTNENLLTTIISFHDKMNYIKVQTENDTSTLDYQQFIDLKNDSMGFKKGTLGITYGYKKNNTRLLYDFFENGTLIIWLDNKVFSKRFCPELKLDITRVP